MTKILQSRGTHETGEPQNTMRNCKEGINEVKKAKELQIREKLLCGITYFYKKKLFENYW